MSLFDTGFQLGGAAPANDVSAASRKRKRPHDSDTIDKDSLVAAANINVDKLLSKLRTAGAGADSAKPTKEGREMGKPKSGKVEKQKQKQKQQGRPIGTASAPRPAADGSSKAAEGGKPSKADKKREKKRRKEVNGATAESAPVAATIIRPLSPVANTSKPLERTTLSPPAATSAMQSQMREKLGGARFRFINEQLYTVSGGEAQRIMDDDPTVFLEYHVGFRSQSDRWPVHPLHLITKELEGRSINTLIADLGCGDASLAKALKPKGIRVLSYDLVADIDWVVRAQCSQHVPLPSGVVDVVVCCLSLMGMDWVGMVKESRRILVEGGLLKIAEVTSRFTDVDAFVRLVENVGFKLKHKDASNSHFILFDFVRYATVKTVDEGKAATLLKPCIYKKR